MITASIVTYKTDQVELETVLKCLCNSIVEKVYVVDNSPTSSLKRTVLSYGKAEYIFGHGNIGYGAAHNLAIRKLLGTNVKYHLVINSDIDFDKKVVTVLEEFMDLNPDIGLVMPKIFSPNGDLQYLCKLLPTPLDMLGRRFSPLKFIQYRNSYFEMRLSGYNKIMDVPFLSGCFMFLRVNVLLEINGFSDDFFMYCEDIDICRRIKLNKFRTVFYPNVSIVHVHKKESYKNNKMLIIHIKSAIKYFNKWGWFWDPFRKNVNKEARSQYKL